MNWKLVIFDLDGTLIDTIADLGTAVNHALEHKGLPPHNREEYRLMVGNGVRNLVWRAMPDSIKDDKALHEALLADFMEYYCAHINIHSRPYGGMAELLGELQSRGIRLAVASNKFQAGTEALVGKFFPDVNFACVFGGRDGMPLKPDPAVVKLIMETASAAPEETVMVGDSATDTATAAAAGIRSIAVSWGFRPSEAAASADYVAGSVAELRGLLL